MFDGCLVNVEGISLGFRVVGRFPKRKEGIRSKNTRRRGKNFATRKEKKKRIVQDIKMRGLQEVTMLIKDADMEKAK